jgi:hypothetical protein
MAGYSGNHHYILFAVSYYGLDKAYKGMAFDEGNHNHTGFYLICGYI